MPAQILIVDDEVTLLNTLTEYLEIAGYPAKSAISAEKASDLLRKKRFDVVITDIALPGMDGMALTELIKKNYDIDVIMMTAYRSDHSYEEAIEAGASDFVIKPFGYEELLLRLKRVLNERKLTHEQNRMLEKLKRLATIDGLTKLYNSRHFYNQLQLEVDRSIRYNHQLSLLLLDIDRFKQFNDSFGHLEGDQILMKLGKTVLSCLRKMDSAYRYGGEEFTIILPETTGEEAVTVAERIRIQVSNDVFIISGDQEQGITVSIGVTQYLPNEILSVFIKRSDEAMYVSKDRGRNRVAAIFSATCKEPV